MIVYLIAGLIKKFIISYFIVYSFIILWIKFFPKPYKLFGRNIYVKVDLSNYATKTDIKNISHVDTSSFALTLNLASLKTEVDK